VEPVALISRGEELDKIKEENLNRFQECLEFMDVQEEADDEKDGPLGSLNQGLHAKAYLAEVNSRTHLFMGSANATSAALRNGKNVEILVELVGRTSQVGGIQSIYREDGLTGVLQKYNPPKDITEEDPEVAEAEGKLDRLQQNIMTAKLLLKAQGDADQWQVDLMSDRTIDFSGFKKVQIWPVTLPPNQGIKIPGFTKDEKIPFVSCSLASLTQFIAFELVSEKDIAARKFVLNVSMEGLPDERAAAVTKAVVETKEGFLRYLLLILSEMEDLNLNSGLLTQLGLPGKGKTASFITLDELPLLEELTRAYCRDPERIRSIEKLLSDLEKTPEGKSVIPDGFHLIWSAFQEALGK
jgi:hypothetical protein